MSKSIKEITDVTSRQLCTGCGVCAFMEPERFQMGDALELGRRPFVRADAVAETGKALQSCPGTNLTHAFDKNAPGLKVELADGWGPVLDVWEGFSADEGIRKGGSSGGAATTLAVFGVERKGYAGALHIKARGDIPYLNETTLSRCREELAAATGSRYAPASPCDGLDLMLKEDAPSVFIGKPCDVAAVQKARKLDPELDKKIGVTIAFFCAGTPSTKGTLELLKREGVPDPANLKSLRFRGNGWPGMWTAVYNDNAGEEKSVEMTYADSWGFLQKYRQWRCYICPDHTGEFADIAVGDPWYRPIEEGEPGKSLIVARTEKGRQYILDAAAAGYITLENHDLSLFPRSQPNLLGSRGSVWARLHMLRLFGAAVPKYIGFKMARFWWSDLSLNEKRQSITGTILRIFRKRLNKRIDVESWTPPAKEKG
ncbi:Coenzyme F420 hydrogenase/dehydrogenase, beta subunit C-terminal domain [uncultured Sneathiella sp.]|uniref:Coenzyme F420 hydrogenase/dehydrogenase, beta subunit C-terminal domain n=1 Tax=uncultured Sneathiella sp. TaxID=879315 RepID=UPI00259A6B3A|nr:Coenzyme F420 hydrogenase/dehydrogenase, beta subunit C-terminal domain [uncultured Sneathiella sp.]